MYRPSPRGIAYLAAGNFMARGLILTASFISAFFTDDMAQIYSAHVEVPTMLFFQSIYMIPVFCLGGFVFTGIEKDSFSLVLYPSLGILLVILIRYGAELCLIIMHWEYYSVNFPTVFFYLIVDLAFLSILLLYVYFRLTGVEDSAYPKIRDSVLLPDDSNLPKCLPAVKDKSNRNSQISAPACDEIQIKTEKVIPRFQYLRRKQPKNQEEPSSRPGSRPSSFISLTLSSLVTQNEEEATNKMLLDSLQQIPPTHPSPAPPTHPSPAPPTHPSPAPPTIETQVESEVLKEEPGSGGDSGDNDCDPQNAEQSYDQEPEPEPPVIERSTVCKVTAV